MNIVFSSSELVPFSKTGGLADVSMALPQALVTLGHDVSLFTPYYRCARRFEGQPVFVLEGQVAIGTEYVPFKVYKSNKTKTLHTYLIENNELFDREGIYGGEQGEYPDSSRRFIFFSRAVLEAARLLNLKVDIFHANDWQTALIPTFLKLDRGKYVEFAEAGTLFTIHNIAYQGCFWHWDWPLLNLPWQHFNWRELEFHGKVSLLKGGLICADLLNTVSPTYAHEIRTAEFGCGLEGVLEQRASDLYGVLNGIDDQEWDPASDTYIARNFSLDDRSGKAQCKAALQARFELPVNPELPVLGLIGRVTEQKGFDLVAYAAEEFGRRPLQLMILGAGDKNLEQRLRRMKELYPDKIGLALRYDNELAHMIEAGSDMFIMPCKFEPCGLNQFYSMRYGTIPVVRGVGGLKDSVTDLNESTLADGSTTGFVFKEHTKEAMMEAIDRALGTYRQPEIWSKLMLHGMSKDFSWRSSAAEYVKLYGMALEKVKQRSV